jgi:hypothetical protein
MWSCIKLNTCYSGYHLKYAAKGGAKEHTVVHKGLWWGHEKENKSLSKMGIILIRILQKQDGKAWNGLIWLLRARK